LRILREADFAFSGTSNGRGGTSRSRIGRGFSTGGPKCSDQHQGIFELSREMRNRVAHTSPGKAELDREAVKAMISGLRTLSGAIGETARQIGIVPAYRKGAHKRCAGRFRNDRVVAALCA